MLGLIPFACQGMKIVKCAELSAMWKYQKKQKKKVSLLESLERAAHDGTGSSVLQAGAVRAGRVESVELSPALRR